jgi:hypothetical protein
MGYNYAARLCLPAAIDIQRGEIVGGKLRGVTDFGLSEKRQNRKKERLKGVFQQNQELFRIPGL